MTRANDVAAKLPKDRIVVLSARYLLIDSYRVDSYFCSDLICEPSGQVNAYRILPLNISAEVISSKDGPGCHLAHRRHLPATLTGCLDTLSVISLGSNPSPNAHNSDQ